MINLFQRLPDFKGKRRIARLFLSSFIRTQKDIQFTSVSGIRYLLPNCRENIGFEIIVNGGYEKETVKFIVERLPRNGKFLDIGANIGAIAIPVACKRPDIAVIGIEASSRIFGYLEINVKANNVKNCLVLKNAVSDTDDQEVSFFSPEEKFGKGSLAPVFTLNAESVKTITMDRIFDKYAPEGFDLLKVDIEGFEYFAFKGGAHSFNRKDAPDILFEFVDWAEVLAKVPVGKAQQLLLDFGYKLYHVDQTGLVFMKNPKTKGSAMIFATKKNV